MRLGIATPIVMCIAIAACAPAEKSIRWDQIDKEVKIIGPLGVPIGKVVTIRGYGGRRPPGSKIQPHKGESNEDWVRVVEVDSRPVPSPLVIELRPLAGERFHPDRGVGFTAIGYQEGYYEGVSTDSRVPPIQSRARHFRVDFIAIEFELIETDRESPVIGPDE